jgi:3-oxoacyl-[acyl-carrier-protein] synthase-3
MVRKLNFPLATRLESKSGISERRVCSNHEDSLWLAAEAARDCIAHSSYGSGQVEMIIYCAISKYLQGLKYLYEPSMAFMVREELGNKVAICFDLSNACSGMMTGVHVGSNFIQQGVVSNCLLVGGEYISSLGMNALKNINSPFSPEIASLTVGDAGGALMLARTNSSEGSISVSNFVTLGKYCDLCIAQQSERQKGGIMRTRMKEIHDVSLEHAPPIMERALSEAGLKLDQIDFLIPHQTSQQAINAGKILFTEYFKCMARQVINNLKWVGNTASTSHVLALHKLLVNQELKEGNRVMLLSFASGLVIGVIIFTVHPRMLQDGSGH